MLLLELSLSRRGLLFFLIFSFLGLILLTFILYKIMWIRLQKIIDETKKKEAEKTGTKDES